ncbi:MAG TPA: tetratricopeptide repeat protein [Candidatus Acidoferrales bacterium]|nr:tetratricopeptide repeat protein [Candidatus Acidoferrales bacterium]
MRRAAISVAALILWPYFSAAAQTEKPQQQKETEAGNKQTAFYNPYRAVHDVEVGKFYLKRGDFDGAIGRFKEALLYKDNYAEPRLLLGEAYEKKGDPSTAIRYYQEYLKILPRSAESARVRERIARLQEKIRKVGATPDDR